VSAALQEQAWIGDILPVETNILIFSVKGKYSAQTLVDALETRGARAIKISCSQVRMVFHLDVTTQMTDRLTEIIRNKL
jgi:threonine aldolase